VVVLDVEEVVVPVVAGGALEDELLEEDEEFPCP
jgi:hypothetical protein